MYVCVLLLLPPFMTPSPPEDSKNMRYQLISSEEVGKVIGKTRAFDGMTLFLPEQITDSVSPSTHLKTHCAYTTHTPLYAPYVLHPQSIPVVVTRPSDGSRSTVTITFVTVVQYANCTQLFNIIFRRILRHLEMKQVGRYYYDPYNPIAIPQHK